MHVIKGRSRIIMGNQGCSAVMKGNNTLLYLAQVSILNSPVLCEHFLVISMYEQFDLACSFSSTLLPTT
jgi:hypothetical protein